MNARFVRWVSACAASLLVAWSPAHAAVTYQYAGAAYDTLESGGSFPGSNYTTSMSLSGSLTLDSPVPNFLADISGSILDYSFTDGLVTYTPSNSFVELANARDIGGTIALWDLLLGTTVADVGDITSSFRTGWSAGDVAIQQICLGLGSGGRCAAVSPEPFIRALATEAGAWTVVPLPVTAWLFGSALGLLGWIRSAGSGVTQLRQPRMT